MRNVFFLILLLPVIVQGYVCWRLWQLMPLPVWIKVVTVCLLVLAFGLFFLSMMPQLDRLPMPFATFVYHIGTSWMIVLLYLFMLFVVVDILRLCHIIPQQYLHHSWIGTAVSAAMVFTVLAYGYARYINKVRVELPLYTSKPLSKPLRIIMTSDWHLGYHNNRAELSRWIDLINAEDPDLILVAGDIIDRSIRPLDEERMAEEFHRLRAPVYACLGNHEYYSGKKSALRFYQEAGIHLLQDSVAIWDDVAIIGRDDMTNRHRLPLSKLTASVPSAKYMILLDHQPYHLDEAESSGIDFELAGHTHHGQVWPASWITEWIYECAFGEHHRGNTCYYVSSGLGIWGGKFRIGTQSEYIVATLNTD